MRFARREMPGRECARQVYKLTRVGPAACVLAGAADCKANRYCSLEKIPWLGLPPLRAFAGARFKMRAGILESKDETRKRAGTAQPTHTDAMSANSKGSSAIEGSARLYSDLKCIAISEQRDIYRTYLLCMCNEKAKMTLCYKLFFHLAMTARDFAGPQQMAAPLRTRKYWSTTGYGMARHLPWKWQSRCRGAG